MRCGGRIGGLLSLLEDEMVCVRVRRVVGSGEGLGCMLERWRVCLDLEVVFR